MLLTGWKWIYYPNVIEYCFFFFIYIYIYILKFTEYPIPSSVSVGEVMCCLLSPVIYLLNSSIFGVYNARSTYILGEKLLEIIVKSVSSSFIWLLLLYLYNIYSQSGTICFDCFTLTGQMNFGWGDTNPYRDQRASSFHLNVGRFRGVEANVA